jgi:hypothetical protein
VADEIARHRTGDPIAILVAASSDDIRQLIKTELHLHNRRNLLFCRDEAVKAGRQVSTFC